MIEINATIIAQVLNFLILVVILRAVAYKPVARLLQQRSDKIKNSLEQAEADRKAAEQTLAQYKAQLSDAQQKAQAIVEKANLTARQEHDAAVAETRKEIERMKQTAQAEIESERNRSFEEMKSQIVTLSLAAAGKIVTKNLDTKENDKLVNDFISKLNKDMFADLK
ncbi:MAG: F0F1 ATP synthase subunit B [Selenomonadaceae bacterium]|nr:F0F1 ATP synthase subunit B [Selenomonadaceae bacterium]MBQ7493236.1 F0F1 ATP synthase subunit B [Selenomonadaceae bacterium]